MYNQEDIAHLRHIGYAEKNIMNVHKFGDGHIVKLFFDSMKRDMEATDNPFRVDPFSVFFLRDDTANALASLWNGRYMIVFHTGLLRLLDDTIVKKVPKVLKPEDGLKLTMENYLGRSVQGFLFEMLTTYIYNHELAHLNQYKFGTANTALVDERLNLVAGTRFEPVKHAMEVDADVFAAVETSRLIFQYWHGIPDQLRKTSQLSALVAAAAAGIFLFWYSMAGGWAEPYFLDHTHPHVLIRTYLIFEKMTSPLRGAGNVGDPFDEIVCQRNTFWIVSQLLQEPNSNGLRDFWTLFEKNAEKMEEYFQKHLVPISKGLPFLVQWNVPGGQKYPGNSTS